MIMIEELNQRRARIDAIDAEIVRLLNDRYREVLAIGEWKRERNLPVFVPERERALLARLDELNAGGVMPGHTLRAIWREVISGARALETRPRVACLGPEGSFSHQAVLERFGREVDIRPMASIAEVFRAIETERADSGCVPVENTTEGVVTYTLDMLMYSPVGIVDELEMAIRHCLLSRSPRAAIAKIYTHPQVLGQCRGYLLREFPAAELVETTSTARAAELAASTPGTAALAGRIASELYDLPIVEENVEDSAGNRTRFLVLGRHEAAPTGDDKTSLCIGLIDRPGALYGALAPFEKRGITLTMIESRPLKNANFEYAFFIDLIGHRGDPGVAAACGELKQLCSFFKILGSYPCAPGSK